MIFAELAGGIAQAFECRRKGACLRRNPNISARLSDSCQPCADWQFASDKSGASGRAASLGVVVSEHHSFGGELV